MNYTNEKPTVPGWYWYRFGGITYPNNAYIGEIVYLSKDGRFSRIGMKDEPRDLSGQFAGPIEEPSDTTMNYTNEKPTMPGWYWYQTWGDGGYEGVIKIVYAPGDNLDGFALGELVEETDEGLLQKLPKDGQFAGPLPRASHHPVDALKACGVPMTPEAEAHARAYCDEIVPTPGVLVDDTELDLLDALCGMCIQHASRNETETSWFFPHGVTWSGLRLIEIDSASEAAAAVLVGYGIIDTKNRFLIEPTDRTAIAACIAARKARAVKT